MWPLSGWFPQSEDINPDAVHLRGGKIELLTVMGIKKTAS